MRLINISDNRATVLAALITASGSAILLSLFKLFLAISAFVDWQVIVFIFCIVLPVITALIHYKGNLKSVLGLDAVNFSTAEARNIKIVGEISIIADYLQLGDKTKSTVSYNPSFSPPPN